MFAYGRCVKLKHWELRINIRNSQIIATYVQQCMHTHHIHIHKYSDGSVVDVSCSRLVRYEERDKTPGLAIFRRGPATWVPIQAAKQEPIAARTTSILGIFL